LELNAALLDGVRTILGAPTDLNACLNAHGLYNTEQFVLRLSPEVHRRMAAIPAGIVQGLDADDLQAYSTYLHETIHWWQHVGSTIGLMLSLSYPSQAHANSGHLRRLIEQIGPRKSLLRWVELNAPTGGSPTTAGGLANIVVNNYFDIEFFRMLVTSPSLLSQAVEHRMFESIGHSHFIAYANAILILKSTLGAEFDVVDDPTMWKEPFEALRSKRATGYYFGSDVIASPIGAHHIFEGQARFAQLQFLHFASSKGLNWDRIRAAGMLHGIYGEAFETFLRLAHLEWPESVDDPIVALFLLVCDVAMNSGAGFPMPLRDFTTFIEDVDPGMRFIFLCRVIATQRMDLGTAIRDYSREEYIAASDALTRPLLIDPPLTVAETVSNWHGDSGAIRSLMAEYDTFAYDPRNLPVRLLVSHFVAFNRDKLSKPEFFCWPGAYMAGARVSVEGSALLERNLAPFLDKPDDTGIYPRSMAGRDQATVQVAFDRFYAANVIYDMTRQWIVRDGQFQYDYRSLSSSGTDVELKGFADRHFEMVYGVYPDAFEIL